MFALLLFACAPSKVEPPPSETGRTPHSGRDSGPDTGGDTADSGEPGLRVVWAGWPTPRVASGPTMSHTVTQDVNGDGLLDLLGCRDRLYWALQPGGPWLEEGAWAAPWQRGADLGEVCLDLDIADVDGDGDSDALATMDGSGELLWFVNEGGSFGAGAALATGLVANATLAVGDFDGDGRVDLAAAPWVLWSEGGGTFTAARMPCGRSAWRLGALALLEGGRSALSCGAEQWVADPGRSWVEVPVDDDCQGRGIDQGPGRVGDMDGDGHADTVIDGVVLCRGDGQGGLTGWARLFEPTDTAWISQMVDVDDDGDLDLVVNDESAGVADLRLFAGDGVGFTEIDQLWLPHSLHQGGGALWQDLDADGSADLLAWDAHSRDFALYRSDGAGFLGPQVVELPGLEDGEVTAVDLDGDARPELVALSADAAWVGWPDGLGGFTWGEPTPLPAAHRSYLARGGVDLDGDGDEELWSPYPRPLVLDWDGAALGVSELNLTVTVATARVWTPDLDGDGDSELVLENVAEALGDLDGDGREEDPEAVRVGGLGEGLPTVWTDLIAEVGVGVVLALTATADLDGDGLSDLTLVDAAGVSVWGWDGERLVERTRSELAWAATAPALDTRRGLGAADADGDGDVDLWLALSGEDAVLLLLNDGAGGFVLGDRTPAPAEMVDTSTLRLEPLLDGALQAWAVDEATAHVRSWREQDGTWTALPVATPAFVGGVTVRDLDTDGAAELVGAIDDRVFVYPGTVEEVTGGP